MMAAWPAELAGPGPRGAPRRHANAAPSPRTSSGDHAFDTIFTADKPVIFAFHGYPWLIHRLTYRRTNHANLYSGYKEEGTTTTPFAMCVLNQLERFNLVNDVIVRVPKLGARAAYAQQAIREKLVDHKTWIREHGDDMPEIRDWKSPQAVGATPRARGRGDTGADNL